MSTAQPNIRSRHRIVSGTCKRCALSKSHGDGRCPPGFWMTNEELGRWLLLDVSGQMALERELGTVEAAPAPGDPREGG